MSPDSIDTLDKITIDVEYNEAERIESTDWNTPTEFTEAEIISVECNGVCVSDFISTLFTDDELLNAQSDLETESSLENVKLLLID